MTRLFVAVEVPDEVKDQLHTLCTGLRDARWTRDRQFHVTLRFLGEVEPPKARALEEVLHGVRAEPFELALSGVGLFPPRGKPKILWAGVAPREPLADLHHAVGRALRHAGVGPDERKFAAHITLARLHGTPLHQVVDYFERHRALRCEPFPVTGFTLFSSSLSREGAQHRAVAEYPLFGKHSPTAPRWDGLD